MLLSMTGFGEAHGHVDGLSVVVEMRTVNNRFFKLSAKTPEGYGALEPQIEALVRKRIKRGTIQVFLRIDRIKQPEDFKLNVQALSAYRAQLEELHAEWDIPTPVKLDHLLILPGVVQDETDLPEDAARHGPVILPLVEQSLDRVCKMRSVEGEAMSREFKKHLGHLEQQLKQVEARSPNVTEDYRKRLTEKINTVLAEHELKLDDADLIREISIFAERGDIAEEIARLHSHLQQFHKIMEAPESSGRKLDFLTQELVREANTIGSKANDLQIAGHVVEMKATIEKIREMIQNVE